MPGREIPLEDPDEQARREADLKIAEQLEVGQEEDFDAFWDSQDRKPTTLRNVFGVDVTLPPALPLRFEVEARRVAESKHADDTKRMVGILFGADALDVWTDKGMDLEQFAVLLMWGTSNTRAPGSMTLREAREIYINRVSSGKAETQSPPAAGSGAASSATGPPSKRTSAASTASRKPKSRSSARAAS